MTTLPPLLLIEDNEELRQEMSEYFRRRGRTVIPCGTLGEARSAMASSALAPPAAIICDANLPDGSGIDFCVEAAARLPGCQWILISGAHEADRLEEAMSAGARFDVVDKPVSLRRLNELLAAGA